MKKRGNIQKLTSFFLVFVMLLGVLIPMQPVFAEGLERVETKITNFTITTTSGNIPSGGYVLDNQYVLHMDWDASYYQNNLKEGDFFNITLPKEFNFPTNNAACNFDVLTPDGSAVVAKAVVTPNTQDGGGGNIKVTFTKYVEDRYDIKGSIQLAALFNTKVINTPGEHEITVAVGSYPVTIPINVVKPTLPVDELLQKWASPNLTNEGHVQWSVRINLKKSNLTNVVLEDKLEAESGDLNGIEYVPNSFILQERIWDDTPQSGDAVSATNISDQVQLSDNNTKFRYEMGNIDGKQYMLKYKTTYKSGLKLKNNVILDSSEEDKEKTYTFSDATSGGQGSGDLTSKIKIVKVDAEDHQIKLADAKFLITKLADNSTFTLTTNSEGEAISNKLIPGKYKIKEMQAPDGYKFNNEEYEVEVTSGGACIKEIENEPEKTEIKVEKVWVGKKGNSITAVLKADGKVIDRHVITAPTWEYTFEGLRKYDIDTGEEIRYTVEEENVPEGYTANYIEVPDMEGYWIIENKLNKTEVKVTKEWEGVTGEKPAIKLQLLKNGQAEGVPVELTNGTTTHTWTELDKIDSQGNEYTYTVKEVGETGSYIQIGNDWYKVVYDGNQEDGLSVTNKKLSSWTPMELPTRDVKVTKLWKDSSGTNLNEAPVDKIKVELYKDGVATGDIKELTKDNNWTVTFEKLPVSALLGGVNHEYSVKEVGESEKAIQLNGKWYNVTYGGTMKDGLTITNKEKTPWTPMEPPTRTIKVTKEWKNDNGNALTAPVEKIEVELYKDGVATGKKLELTKDNNWSGEFKKLEVANGLGSTNYYQYTVKEIGETTGSIKLDGKWFKVSYTGSMKDGFTITNQKEKPWTPMVPPTRDVKVTKLWKDHNGNTITAPTDKIIVELYKDGNPTGKKEELSAENNWTVSFKNLEVANGLGSTDYYKYTVKEIGEDGNAVKFDGKQYKVVYGGSMKDGLTITNEKEAPPTPPTPNNPTPNKPEVPNTSTNKTLPKTGDGSNISLYAWLMLTSGALLVLIGYKRRKHAK